MQKIEEELEYPNFVLIAQLQFLIFFRRIAKTLSWMQNTSTGYSCQNQNVELYKLWQDNKNALLRLQLLQILVNSDLASLKRVNTAVHVNVFVTIAEHKYWISLSRLQNNCISFLCHDCSLQNNSISFLCHDCSLQNNCISFLCHDCSLQNNSIFFLCHNYRLQNTSKLDHFVTIAEHQYKLSFVVKIAECRTPVQLQLSLLRFQNTSWLILSWF